MFLWALGPLPGASPTCPWEGWVCQMAISHVGAASVQEGRVSHSQPPLGPRPSHVPLHPHDIFKTMPPHHAGAEGQAAKGGEVLLQGPHILPMLRGHTRLLSAHLWAHLGLRGPLHLLPSRSAALYPPLSCPAHFPLSSLCFLLL